MVHLLFSMHAPKRLNLRNSKIF